MRRKIVTGAAWMVSSRLMDRLIGMASSLVLARLLAPKDFGLVALATTLVGILELFSEFGADAALIRHPDPTPDHYNTAWSIEVLKNLVLGVLLMILASPSARFFNSPDLVNIVYAIAGIWMLKGFTNIGIVDFRRNLQFDREFSFLLTTRLGSTLITIVSAWYLRDHRALLLGMLGNTLCKLLLSYRMHSYRPKLSIARLAEVFRFSRWIILQSAFSGLSTRVPNLAIGHFSGTAEVGYFSLSDELSNLASTEISAPIRRALYPGFSKLADDSGELARHLLEAHGIVLLLTLPIPIIIGFLASLIVPLLFGTQWLEAVPLLEALALLGVLKMLGTHSHIIYLVMNRPKWTSLISCVRLVILAPLTLMLVRDMGPVGAAHALTISLLISLIVDYSVLFRLLPISPMDFLKNSWRILVASFVVAVLLYVEKQYLPTALSALDQMFQISLFLLLGCCTYLGTLFLIWKTTGHPQGPEQMVFSFIKEILRAN